jgi:hypothetical protein
VKEWAAPPRVLDELRTLIRELLGSFQLQRRAIAQLAGDQLSVLVSSQSQICSRIEALLATNTARDAVPEALRNVMSAVRLEAEATALLATTAAQNVRFLIEQNRTSGYNATARPTRTTSPICLLTTL